METILQPAYHFTDGLEVPRQLQKNAHDAEQPRGFPGVLDSEGAPLLRSPYQLFRLPVVRRGQNLLCRSPEERGIGLID